MLFFDKAFQAYKHPRYILRFYDFIASKSFAISLKLDYYPNDVLYCFSPGFTAPIRFLIIPAVAVFLCSFE